MEIFDMTKPIALDSDDHILNEASALTDAISPLLRGKPSMSCIGVLAGFLYRCVLEHGSKEPLVYLALLMSEIDITHKEATRGR